MIYQDPLAYLLGLEGIALLDAWAGDHDRAFTDARLAEIRRLLDDEKLRDRGVFAERVSTVLAYQQWAAGAEPRPAGTAVRGADRYPDGPTAARARDRDRRLAGLAVVADGLLAIGGAGR